MKVIDFKGKEPQLVLEDYFLGETKAYGIFEDRFGNLRRQFQVTIEGMLEDGTLVLDENFLYADGETDRRVWRIWQPRENTYVGEADDVNGLAKGKAYGNALNWQYNVDLKIGGWSWNVHFDDWMFLQPGGVLINRAMVSKFGLTLGTVTIVFKQSEILREAA